MIKKLFLFLIFTLFFISRVYGLELSASPGYIDFNGKTNQEICNEVLLQSDYNGTILSELKWSNNKKTEYNINDYNIKSNELNIIEDFSKQINIKKVSLKKQICLTFNEPGEYNGALIFKTQDSLAGVGIWIKADISGKKTKKQDTGQEMQKITSLSILNPLENKSNINGLILISTISTIILITILLTLIFARRIK